MAVSFIGGLPGENHRPATSHWQILSHYVVLIGIELTTLVVIGTDCIGSCKSNYHTITTAPVVIKNFFKWTDNILSSTMICEI